MGQGGTVRPGIISFFFMGKESSIGNRIFFVHH